jgi:hypothetical protein
VDFSSRVLYTRDYYREMTGNQVTKPVVIENSKPLGCSRKRTLERPLIALLTKRGPTKDPY